MTRIRLLGLLLPCLVTSSLAGGVQVSQTRMKLGTLVSISLVTPEGVNADALLEEAFAEIDRLEAILSDWRDDSELMQLNRVAARKTVDVSEDLARILQLSQRLHESTDGGFDPTVGPLTHRLREGPVTVARRHALVSRVGMDGLILEGRRVRFRREGMILDLGAIGKGYVADRLKEFLEARKVEEGFLDLGTSTQLGFGDRDWMVLLTHMGGRAMSHIVLRDASLSTSESSIEKDHIVDPRTGMSVRARRKVTVCTEKATQAEALSTALVVRGRILLSEDLLSGSGDWIRYEDRRGIRILGTPPARDPADDPDGVTTGETP